MFPYLIKAPIKRVKKDDMKERIEPAAHIYRYTRPKKPCTAFNKICITINNIGKSTGDSYSSKGC